MAVPGRPISGGAPSGAAREGRRGHDKDKEPDVPPPEVPGPDPDQSPSALSKTHKDTANSEQVVFLCEETLKQAVDEDTFKGLTAKAIDSVLNKAKGRVTKQPARLYMGDWDFATASGQPVLESVQLLEKLQHLVAKCATAL